jgi:2'-5' RNA ligase
MRLFVALRFPESVQDRLDQLISESRGLPGAAWCPSDQYHLTLRFIGDPSPLGLHDIARALREVRAGSFHLDLKGAGHFPLRGHPETLWVGAAAHEDESGDPLLRLRHRVESALARAGLPAEGRKFHPHVSLARVKHAEAQDVAAFEIINGLFGLNEIPIQEFCLVSSELRPGGAVHTVEEIYPLEGLLEGEEELVVGE